MALDETIREQAAAWAVRVGDPAFDDWEAFTAWLERDPRHARAYDEVMASVMDAAETLPPAPVAQNDDEPAFGGSRRRWFGAAIAAVLTGVAAFGAWQLMPGTYTVETAPGETRLVELDGGGQILLAGGTRMVFDRSDPHSASLENGQALFTLRHDSARPFTLTVGEDTLVDVGTVFDVEHGGGRMTVAVSEGAVAFNPRGQNVRVDPGQMLSSEAGSGQYHLTSIPVDQVGEWREGRLTFQDATLAEVAADLSRATGVTFAVAERSAESRVSGSLVVEPLRSDPRALGPLLGVSVRYNGEAWEIGQR